MKKIFATFLFFCSSALGEIPCTYGPAIPVGTTDVSVMIRIVDSTDFSAEEGVTSATGGLALWYKEGEHIAHTEITESDLAAMTDAHSDGGMLHEEDGYYRVDLPDDCCDASDNFVQVGGTATGMIVIGTLCPLDMPANLLDAAAIADSAIDAATFAADTDSYQAQLHVLVTPSTTEYSVFWEDNGVIATDATVNTLFCEVSEPGPTSGLSAGDDKVGTSASPTSFTGEGAVDHFYLTDSYLLENGVIYACRVQANIDSSTRTDWFDVSKTAGSSTVTVTGSSVGIPVSGP